jgi:PncC family amidohydrolase
MLEEEIGIPLRKNGLKIAIAESCTGGLVSHRITNVAGSSDYYEGTIVSYSNEIKERVLGVDGMTLRKFGAVSSQCAKEMSEGIRNVMKTDIGLAITGIAGPGGGTREKPVGLVYVALSSDDRLLCKRYNFHGDRMENKQSASDAALSMLKEYLIDESGR